MLPYSSRHQDIKFGIPIYCYDLGRVFSCIQLCKCYIPVLVQELGLSLFSLTSVLNVLIVRHDI
jgi:hypothetical protein